MRTTPPFAGAAYSEVLARVAYAVIKRDYCRSPEHYTNAPLRIINLSAEMTRLGLDEVGFWIYAYEHNRTNKRKTISIRAEMILRSRAGLPWRDCAFFAYKLTRRRPPC